MKRFALVLIALALACPALAQNAAVVTTCGGLSYTSGTSTPQTQDTTGSHCVTSVLSSQYPQGATPLTGNSTGTTGAVVGTLTGAASKTTYICGFNVSATGGTASIGPITIAGLTGSSMVFQLFSTAAGANLSHSFNPCIPASATNTSITTTTTANGTATAVDVNTWGYRQ